MPEEYPHHGGATKTALRSVQQRGKMETGRFAKTPSATNSNARWAVTLFLDRLEKTALVKALVFTLENVTVMHAYIGSANDRYSGRRIRRQETDRHRPRDGKAFEPCWINLVRSL